MNKAEHLKPWLWRPGESGNLAGRPKKPRRSFDAVRRFEALGVDPLAEVVALAQDPALPKPLRLKAWLDLCEFAYPKLSPIASHENMSVRLEELQRAWNTETWGEFKEAFRQELSTLPEDTRRALEKLDTKGEIGPLVMRVLLKFVEQRTESQAKAQNPQDPEEGGLRWSSYENTWPLRHALRHMSVECASPAEDVFRSPSL